MTNESNISNMKERLIAAASGRFVEDGFSAVTVDEIAGGLGISKKTFYKHFASKDELLLVVTDRLLEGIRSQFRTIAEADTGFPEKLEALVMFLGERITRLSKPLLRDLQKHAPHIWSRVEQFRRERILNDLRGLLLKGVREGFVRSDVDIDLFLMGFIGAAEAVVNPAVLADHPLSVREVIHAVMTVFIRGILTGPGLEEFARAQSRNAIAHVSQLPGVS